MGSGPIRSPRSQIFRRPSTLCRTVQAGVPYWRFHANRGPLLAPCPGGHTVYCGWSRHRRARANAACHSATVTENRTEPAKVVVGWAQEELPRPWAASVFLAGPTPRDEHVASWRPQAVEELRRRWQTSGHGRLVVFVPELRAGRRFDGGDWDAQVA